MVSEIDMSLKDLAGADLFSSLCKKAGYDADHSVLADAISGLSASQRRRFGELQDQQRSDIKASVDKKACSDHAEEFRRLKGKKIVVS